MNENPKPLTPCDGCGRTVAYLFPFDVTAKVVDASGPDAISDHPQTEPVKLRVCLRCFDTNRIANAVQIIRAAR